MPPSEPKPPRLLDQLRFSLRTQHYSLRTEQLYVDWIRRFLLLHDERHPKDMGAAEVSAFLTHLVVERHVSASTQNQAKSAILYLYRHVLQQDLPWLDEVVLAKVARRLPVVLSPLAGCALILLCAQCGVAHVLGGSCVPHGNMQRRDVDSM